MFRVEKSLDKLSQAVDKSGVSQDRQAGRQGQAGREGGRGATVPFTVKTVCSFGPTILFFIGPWSPWSFNFEVTSASRPTSVPSASFWRLRAPVLSE